MTRIKKYLFKRQEGGSGQDGETGVDLVSKHNLLRRQEGGLNQDGKRGVDLFAKNDLLKRQEGGPGQEQLTQEARRWSEPGWKVRC